MLIDTHVHTGGSALNFHMTDDMVLEFMKKYGVDYAMVSNCDAAEADSKQKMLPDNLQVTQEQAFKSNLAFAQKHPDKICLALWVKPNLQSATPELETLIKDNLDYVKAIKLHPYHSNISPTDKRVLPFLELAQKYGLAVVSHTGGCENASPTNLAKAAKMFPSVPFVMVHMGLGSDNKEAINLLPKVQNLYGDTTWVPLETTVEVVKLCGSKKIMFGTDAPIDGVDTYKCNPKGDRSLYQDYFQKLSTVIGNRAYNDIMYGNAIRILKLQK